MEGPVVGEGSSPIWVGNIELSDPTQVDVVGPQTHEPSASDPEDHFMALPWASFNSGSTDRSILRGSRRRPFAISATRSIVISNVMVWSPPWF